MLNALRASLPQCHISALVSSEAIELLGEHQSLDTIFPIKQKSNGSYSFWELLHIIKFIRSQNYDILLDLTNTKISLWLALLSKIRYRFSIKIALPLWQRLLSNFAFHFIYEIDSRLAEVFKNLQFLKRILAEPFLSSIKIELEQVDPTPTLYTNQTSLDKVRALLYESNCKQPFIIAPSSPEIFKNWPSWHYAQLIGKLIKHYQRPVILIGNHSDQKTIDRILFFIKLFQPIENQEKVHNFIHKLNHMESLALFQFGKMLVCNDSYLQYMAWATKLPVLTLFGPSLASKEAHLYSHHFQASVEIACRPCMSQSFNHCPQKHFRCMKELTPNQVFHVIKSKL